MTQLHDVTAGRALTTLPGPRGLPLVGNLFQLKVTQLQTTLEHWADTYGPLYTFRLSRKPVVVLAAPDLIQTVLRQRPETFRRMGVIARVLEDIGGNSLFAAEGTAWRRQRRVVMPALSPPQVRQFFPTLTTVTAGLKSRWDRAARTGEVVDMPADLLRYTVEVITRVIFGDDLTHELAGLPQHLGQIFALINRRIMAPWPASWAPCCPVASWTPPAGEPEAARALAERLDAALETAGVEQPAVAIIADSLVSFLLGWGTRYGNLGDEVERGGGVLCLAVTGDPTLLPGGATLDDGHIAQLLSWALLEELEDEP